MNVYIATFIITAIWDVVLRFLAENYEELPTFAQYDFIFFLKPYFKKHTLLSAALVAGFVGATTQPIILSIADLPSKKESFLWFFSVTFTISALYGFVMKFSKLFPHLDDTYYKKLGLIRSMYHDGISGIVVQATLLSLLHIAHIMNNIKI